VEHKTDEGEWVLPKCKANEVLVFSPLIWATYELGFLTETGRDKLKIGLIANGN